MFLIDGLPLAKGTGRRAWGHAVAAAGLDPEPHFHDLRHTWKTNARRSGMDPEIREAVPGHWFKEKSITERYGRVGDQELIQMIDQMTFDHGPSEFLTRRISASICWKISGARNLTTPDANAQANFHGHYMLKTVISLRNPSAWR